MDTVVLIDKLHDCDERICLNNNGYHKKGKITPFQLS